MEMMTLKVPIISIFIGEGGSGGALALAVADEIWMLENSVYSVISPEGCASILWKDPAKVKEASECLKLTSDDLIKNNVVEKKIYENNGQFNDVYKSLKNDIIITLEKLGKLSKEELLNKRYDRFRKF